MLVSEEINTIYVKAKQMINNNIVIELQPEKLNQIENIQQDGKKENENDKEKQIKDEANIFFDNLFKKFDSSMLNNSI